MNERDRAITDAIERESERWTDLTRELVNCDSGTFNKDEADRAGAILAREFQGLGFEVERIPQAQFGDHVIARKPGSGSHRLLFLGHFDTVFPRGTVSQRPFTVSDDHATGPGIYDMKGGLVILIAALTSLRAAGVPFWNEVTLTAVFNSDEEIFSPTSRPLIESEARRADTVCVLEPARPNDRYISSRKGAGMFRLTVTGRAAHSGAQPHLGRSAIVELAHKILLLHETSQPELGTTVNVGVIQGGERANVVPDHATCDFDVRVMTREEAERAQSRFAEIAGMRFDPDTQTTLTGGMMFPPFTVSPCNEFLFQLVHDAGGKLGLDLKEEMSGGVSDGNTAAQFAPVIDGMGVRGAGGHTDHEFIWLSSLIERAQVLALFLTDWPDHAAEIANLRASEAVDSQLAHNQGGE